MNASPLVLSPSGPPNNSPATPASATGTKSANAPGDDSTFAGALKHASPKPARKTTAPKAAGDHPSGGGLPVAGNNPPPQTAPLPQADIQAALVQHAASAAAAGGVDAGRDAEPVAVIGLPANAKQGTGDAADPGSAASAASSQAGTGKLNTALNNSPGTLVAAAAVAAAATPDAEAGSSSTAPATATATATTSAAAATVPARATAAAAGAAGAADAAADAGVKTAPKGTAAAAEQSPTIAALPAGATAAAAKPTVKAPTPAIRPQPTGASAGASASGRAVGAGGGDTDADTDVSGSGSGSGARVGPAQGTVSASGAASDSSAIAAAAASQAADPAGTVAADASDAVAAGIGAAVSGGAAAPATAVALTAARAAATAAASVATAQIAAALATAKEDAKPAHTTADASNAGSTGTDAIASLYQLNPTPATDTTPDTSAIPTFQLHPSLDSGDLAQGLSDRVSYMVANGLNGAKLQVNPPQLGPIELRIAVSGGHAQVWMTTHSAVTRDALETTSPKLREMLGAQGFGQVSVDVSQRSFQDRSGQAQPYQRMASAGNGTATVAASVVTAARRTSLGALDTYA